MSSIEPKPAPFVEIEIGGQQLRCEYDCSPGRPGVHTLRNGDPGYPDEPAEFTVTRTRLFVGATPLYPDEWLDISDLVEELGGQDTLDEKAYEEFEKTLDAAEYDYEPDIPDDFGDDPMFVPTDYNPLGDPAS